MAYFGKPRSGVLFYAGCEDVSIHQQPYFLESCFLCNKPLRPNNDIFMCRRNTPFCSDECRQEQIEKDEAKERSWNMSSTYRAHRKADTPTKSGSKKPVQGTVVVA